MSKISKHYFSFIDAEIVSVEELLKWYFNEDMEKKSFNEFVEEQIEEGDLWNLDEAMKFFQSTIDENVYYWKKECTNMGINPTSADGVNLWYDEYSEQFLECKETLRNIEGQIIADEEE